MAAAEISPIRRQFSSLVKALLIFAVPFRQLWIFKISCYGWRVLVIADLGLLEWHQLTSPTQDMVVYYLLQHRS
jgi:hypothetical protein